MTSTISRAYTILDHKFESDQLIDIVNNGMSTGVGGFIYYWQGRDAFDEYEDDIETYLSDWVYDNLSSETNYIQWIVENAKNAGLDILSIDALKTQMVWAYVELKAFEILSENGYDF
jgi:hypothetical protein